MTALLRLIAKAVGVPPRDVALIGGRHRPRQAARRCRAIGPTLIAALEKMTAKG